jgi:type I restriction enzyme S subunit
MQQKSELPEGWITTTLSSISHKITDGSHNPPQKQSSGKFMISARNIGNDEINFDNARYITENEFQIERQRADIEPGDVLLSIVGTIGRAVVVLKIYQSLQSKEVLP